MAKNWIGIAAALGVATWLGVRADILPRIGEARAEPPRAACRCSPGDLLCAMRCSHRGIPVTTSTAHPQPKRAKPVKAGVPKAPVPAPVTAEPSPADATASITRAGSEPARITVNRPGHIVALSQGMKRSVGLASAAVLLSDVLPPGQLQPQSAVELTWETTRFGTSTIERGTLRLVDEGGTVGARLSAAQRPSPMSVDKRRLHTCASYRDTQSGFTVVCQLDKAAWRVGVANLTGEHPSRDVLSTPGEAPTVRLDLPLVQGGAEARMLGYISGSTGIAIRAEASWIEGEQEPSITFGVVERPDSSFGFFFGGPLDWRRHPLRPHHDLDLLL